MGNTLAACTLGACDATDIYLVDCTARAASLPPPISASASADKEGGASPVPMPPVPPAVPSKNAHGVSAATVAHVIKAFRELFEARAYRKARELLQEKMREVQLHGLEQRSPSGKKITQDASLHEAMAEIFLKTERFDKAVDSAERAVDCRVSIGAKHSSGSTQRYMHFLLAIAHFQAGNYEEAWSALLKTVEQCNMKKQTSTATTIGRTYQHFHLDVAALQAEILFELGKAQQAAEVVNGCMGDPECEKHLSVLLAYARFAAQYGKYEEAIRCLLKVVVLDQGDKRGRRLLARLVDTTTGMQELQSQLPPSDSSASAYAFLATICKEHSAVGAARRMLEMAWKHKPMSASYALNLLHVVELQGDGRYYQEAIQVAEGFLLLNKEFLKVGKKGFTAKQLWQALQEASVEEEGVVGAVVGWLAETETEEDPDTPGEVGALEKSTQGGCAVTFPLRRNTAQPSPAFALDPIEISAEDMYPAESSKEEYDPDALDLLAIAFALVKLLYLQGKLHKLAALYRVIEPTRRRSLTPIHSTTIRNEHAYYQCIAQTLAYRLSCATAPAQQAAAAPLLPLSAVPEPLQKQLEATSASKRGETAMNFPVSPVLRDPRAACCDIYSSAEYKEAAKRPLYVVGDSHTVPLAWNIIRVASESGKLELRLMVPKLVTGLKQYHLRKESDFYPKAQFAALLKSIPDKSDIMFIVGEIDCREGILVGVQRDSYDSIRQGMEATITHFAQVLPNLIKQRKMHITIHPVLPMLSETRSMVATFNEHFRRIMETMIPAPGVRWLDFFEDLLVAEPDLQLRQGLRMDGTHITPAYVSLIESAMHDTVAVQELE